MLPTAQPLRQRICPLAVYSSLCSQPQRTDGRVASSVLIIAVCELARGKPSRHPVEPRGCGCHGNASALQGSAVEAELLSQQVCPCDARFALPRRNFPFFHHSSSFSLFLFSMLSHVYPVGHCCHGNVAVRLYRMWLELRRGKHCLFS